MRKRVVLFLVLVLSMAVLCGCGVDEIDISEYENREIVLAGLGEEDEVITIADLKAMDCVTVKTHSTSDKIGEVRATGPLLDTVLQVYGYSQTDFSRIEIYGDDQYDVKLSSNVIDEDDIILAFGIDGEPLDEECKPVRVIIPESDSAYWIRMVNRIEFTK